MLAGFEKVLFRFPFSKLAPVATLRVYAVEMQEPPQMEMILDPPVDPAALIRQCRQFEHADCAYQVETRWDLWSFDRQWRLAPAPVTVTCFGPLFPSEFGEQLLVEFGLDLQFLPQPGVPAGLTPAKSNIRSLLRLIGDIGEAVPLEKKTLWSESGANLAGQLEAALASQ